MIGRASEFVTDLSVIGCGGPNNTPSGESGLQIFLVQSGRAALIRSPLLSLCNHYRLWISAGTAEVLLGGPGEPSDQWSHQIEVKNYSGCLQPLAIVGACMLEPILSMRTCSLPWHRHSSRLGVVGKGKWTPKCNKLIPPSLKRYECSICQTKVFA